MNTLYMYFTLFSCICEKSSNETRMIIIVGGSGILCVVYNEVQYKYHTFSADLCFSGCEYYAVRASLQPTTQLILHYISWSGRHGSCHI